MSNSVNPNMPRELSKKERRYECRVDGSGSPVSSPRCWWFVSCDKLPDRNAPHLPERILCAHHAPELRMFVTEQVLMMEVMERTRRRKREEREAAKNEDSAKHVQPGQ